MILNLPYSTEVIVSVKCKISFLLAPILTEQ